MSGGLLKTFWFEFRNKLSSPALPLEIWRVIKPDFYVDLFMPDKTWVGGHTGIPHALGNTQWSRKLGNNGKMGFPAHPPSGFPTGTSTLSRESSGWNGMTDACSISILSFSILHILYIRFFLHILDSLLGFLSIPRNPNEQRLQRT
jgi:hypothetical protein